MNLPKQVRMGMVIGNQFWLPRQEHGRAYSGTDEINLFNITEEPTMTHKMTKPTRHMLKTWPEYFAGVKSGVKKFEVRKDDRGFHVGDILELAEYDGDFTGDTVERVVSYLLPGGEFGLAEGYVVMGIEPLLDRAEIKSRFGFKQDVWFVKKTIIADGVVIGIRGRMEMYGDPEIEIKVRQTHGEVACEEWMPEGDCFSTANECVQALINSIPDGALLPPTPEGRDKDIRLYPVAPKDAYMPSDYCPSCGAPEVPYNGPQTLYSCGSYVSSPRIVQSDVCAKAWINLRHAELLMNGPEKDDDYVSPKFDPGD